MSSSTKTKSTGRIATLLGCLCVFTLLPSAGWSEDSKVYGASQACNAKRDADTPDLHRNNGGMKNYSASTRQIVCPIVRDNTTNTTGTRSVEIYGHTDRVCLSILDEPCSFKCTLVSRTTAGRFLESDSDSVINPGIVYMRLDVDRSNYNGTYQLDCWLPPGGRLNSYTVSED
jgi:hypothetical protein